MPVAGPDVCGGPYKRRRPHPRVTGMNEPGCRVGAFHEYEYDPGTTCGRFKILFFLVMSVVRGGRRALALLQHLSPSISISTSTSTIRMHASECVASGMSATSAPSMSKAYGMATHLQSRRSAGSLPGDLERAADKTRFPRSSRASAMASEPTTSASVKEEIVDEATAKLHGAQQDVVSNFMFPWERRQMQGGSLNTWERWYWGVFVLAIAVFLFNRTGSWLNSEEDIEKAAAEKRRQEEMERLQVERARLIMTGGSILVGDDEDDPFEYVAAEILPTD